MRILNAALLALAVVACDDTPSEPEFTGGGPTTFRLTDAPFPYDEVGRVDVFVVKVQASWAGDTSAAAGGDFVTVADVNQKIDLLSLEGGLSQVLGTAAVPEGAIKAIRLIIDTDQSSITLKDGAVLTGSTSPGIAWQSSAGVATLNATVIDQIAVPEEGTDVVIDFDVGRAFLDAADVVGAGVTSGFVFSPVLRASAVARTGTITGLVHQGTTVGPAIANATVELKLGNPSNPSNTWSTISTARTDVNGMFKFAYVNRSVLYTTVQPTWSYIVVASKAGAFSGGKTVTVVPGSETATGVIIVP